MNRPAQSSALMVTILIASQLSALSTTAVAQQPHGHEMSSTGNNHSQVSPQGPVFSCHFEPQPPGNGLITYSVTGGDVGKTYTVVATESGGVHIANPVANLIGPADSDVVGLSCLNQNPGAITLRFLDGSTELGSCTTNLSCGGGGPVEMPTLGTWGLILLALALLATGSLALRQKRPNLPA